MKTKRLLSVLTLAALLPLSASADVYQDPETKVNYVYTVGQSEASVGRSYDASGDIAILSSFTVDGNEYAVTSIGSSAFYNNYLRSVTIPESVVRIGDKAFQQTRLTTVNIPESVTVIGEQAFQSCDLTSLIIPKSVTSIGADAFFACEYLTDIMVASGNTTYDSRNNCNAIIETASNTLITGCYKTIIPASVTTIGSGAFYGCSGLTSINIPAGVTTIGYGAFQSCSGLTSITSLIREPFEVMSIVSDDTYSTATLYVPAGTIDAYKATADWNKFEKIVEIGGTVLKGDVNEDGEVGIGDIVAITNFMAGNAGGMTLEQADVNGDGEVGIGDIVAITNIMAGTEN